jgi:hypothetical protein
VEPNTAALIGEYLRSIATWRRQRYQDDLHDARNLRCAAALEELAEYIATLPPSDERLHQLKRLAVEGELFVPGQQTAYEIGRFRFFSEEATLDGFLDRMVELAMADRNEHGQFGGRQVEGDEPWR